jgi:hypothetical protein
MKNYDLGSWDEFPKVLEELKFEYGSHTFRGRCQRNTILYRGQSDASWRLLTTLERYSPSRWTVSEYAHLVLGFAPQVESYTNRHWDLPSKTDLNKLLADTSHWLSFQVPCYEYWIYLRHHRFPSPLLDWTTSPYVALYFALAKQRDVERASVYVYVEKPSGGKGGLKSKPFISVHGPYVKAHERHFLQQSWYTVCIKLVCGSYEFACHEDVFNCSSDDQDVLIKITIPRGERLDILRYLQEMNISELSLFHTEEALMKTLAIEDIELCSS